MSTRLQQNITKKFYTLDVVKMRCLLNLPWLEEGLFPGISEPTTLSNWEKVVLFHVWKSGRGLLLSDRTDWGKSRTIWLGWSGKNNKKRTSIRGEEMNLKDQITILTKRVIAGLYFIKGSRTERLTNCCLFDWFVTGYKTKNRSRAKIINIFHPETYTN